MAYASHRHRSELGDSEVGKSSCLPPSSNEASGAVYLLDRLLSSQTSSFINQTSTHFASSTIACYCFTTLLLYSLLTYSAIIFLIRFQRYHCRWISVSAMADQCLLITASHHLPSVQLSYPHPSRLHRSISTPCISSSLPPALASLQHPVLLLNSPRARARHSLTSKPLA